VVIVNGYRLVESLSMNDRLTIVSDSCNIFCGYAALSLSPLEDHFTDRYQTGDVTNPGGLPAWNLIRPKYLNRMLSPLIANRPG
jgi:hypothetical protein